MSSNSKHRDVKNRYLRIAEELGYDTSSENVKVDKVQSIATTGSATDAVMVIYTVGGDQLKVPLNCVMLIPLTGATIVHIPGTNLMPIWDAMFDVRGLPPVEAIVRLEKTIH